MVVKKVGLKETMMVDTMETMMAARRVEKRGKKKVVNLAVHLAVMKATQKVAVMADTTVEYSALLKVGLKVEEMVGKKENL